MIKMVGVLNIGQGSRPDLTKEIDRWAPGLQMFHAGALDALSEADIYRDKYRVPLLVNLSDGRPALAERDYILERLERLVHGLTPVVDAFAVLCAEDFSALQSEKPLFTLYGVAAALLPNLNLSRPVGAICPVAGQVSSSKKKWRRAGLEVLVRAAAPGDGGAVHSAMADLKRRGVQTVILDCAGFGRNEALKLSADSGLTVLSLRGLMWSVVSQIAIP